MSLGGHPVPVPERRASPAPSFLCSSASAFLNLTLVSLKTRTPFLLWNGPGAPPDPWWLRVPQLLRSLGGATCILAWRPGVHVHCSAPGRGPLGSCGPRCLQPALPRAGGGSARSGPVHASRVCLREGSVTALLILFIK